MRTKVQRWGNSLAVRLPRPITEELGLAEATEVELSVDRGAPRVAPTTKRWSLAELLADVNQGNLHGEVDTGKPLGREPW